MYLRILLAAASSAGSALMSVADAAQNANTRWPGHAARGWGDLSRAAVPEMD